MKRFLCSDLVAFTADGQARFVNLEEIWATGAVVDSEQKTEPGAIASIRAGSADVSVLVERVERHEYGYRVELRFLDYEWSPEAFTPAHLTDLTAIAKAAQKPDAAKRSGTG